MNDDIKIVSTSDQSKSTEETIYDNAIECINQYMFLKAENLLQSIIPTSSNDPYLYPKIISKLILVMYINSSTNKNENIVNIVMAKLKSLPNIANFWEQAINQVSDDIPTTYFKCIRLLSIDYFLRLNPFIYFPAKAENCSFNNALIYVNITKQCAFSLDQQVKKDIVVPFFNRVKQIFDKIDANELRSIDEKKLRNFLKDLREMSPSRDFSSQIDQFETDLMFTFCQSSSLSKVFDGLLRFNDCRSLKPLLDRITKSDIITNILNNIHESLVFEFVKFLGKLFEYGFYNSQILVDFWNISINQHTSVIDKFFEAWSRLLMTLPHRAMPDFWNIIYQTKVFPFAALNFLSHIRSRAPPAVKTEVVKVLWTAMESSANKHEFVLVISDYILSESQQWNEIKKKCFDFITIGQNVGFAVSLLSRIWCQLNYEITQNEFDLLLEFIHIDKTYICVFFDLIKKMIPGLKGNLTESEISQLKPLILIYLEVVSDDVAKRFISDISHHISDESTQELIHWLCSLPNVDRCAFVLVQILFNQINNIQPSYAIESMKKLKGIEPIWELLYKSELKIVPNFLASLASRCSDVETASYFILKCMENINTIGSISALQWFVYKIEDSFDLDSFGIKRNIFIQPESFITVYLDGEITQIIKIHLNTTVIQFISKVARLLHSSENSVSIFYEREKILPNHVFKPDQKFNVQKINNIPPIREWNIKNGELPSQLLQPHFSKIYQLLDTEKTISDSAIRLLNYIPTDKYEYNKIMSVKDRDPGWEELLNPEQPYHMIYRLNIIGNCLLLNNRLFDRAFFENGGFKRILDIFFLKHTNTTILRLVLEITQLLLKIGNNTVELIEMKNNILGNIGSVNLKLFVQWINELAKNENSSFESTSNINNINFNLNILNGLLKVLFEIVQLNKEVLPTLNEFPVLVSRTIFHENKTVRELIMKSIMELDPESYQNVILDNINRSIYGKCTEYFNLFQIIVKTSTQSLELWNFLSDFLIKNLFIFKEINSQDNIDNSNPEIATENGENENETENAKDSDSDKGKDETFVMMENSGNLSEEMKSKIRDLCAFVANGDFVNDIFSVLHSLIFRVENIPNSRQFIDFVINRIIFNTQRMIPLPLTIFSLLEQILLKEPTLVSSVSKQLNHYHMKCKPEPPLEILSPISKSSPKGLVNLGATCYLNSSLQQVLRVDQIRNAILKYNNNDPNIKFRDDWAAQLQLLVAKMIYSPVTAVDTTPFVSLWKGWDDVPINPKDQQDAGEFVQMLLDRLDEKLEGKPVSNSIIGQYEQRIVQINGNYSKESLSAFTVLPLQVKDHTNFKESFKTFLEPDNLTGNDKYSVENLGQIDAERFHTIYKAPESLIILLKRFEFDLETLSSKKVNSYFEFTKNLDINPLISDDAPKVGEYELTGIVMHSGCVIGGHYYSYIKNLENDQWNCYNDSSVYPLESNFLEKCFGGKHNITYYDQNRKRNITELVERNDSAYLLFYKLKSRKVDKTEPISLLPKRALKKLLKDIEKMIIKNMMFSLEYADFVGSFTDYKEESIYEFLVNLVLKILRYPFSLQSIDAVCRRVYTKCQKEQEFSEFFLSKYDEIIDFFLTNDSECMRIKLLYLVNVSIENASKESSTQFVNQILANFESFLPRWHNFDQVFGPILFYIDRIDANRQDILDKIVTFLQNCQTMGDEFLTNVNLSSVFQIFLKIVTKLNKFNEYSEKVTNPQLILAASRSPRHIYDVSLLVMNFQKNNKSATQEFLRSISSSEISPKSLAANFAAAITFEDTLTDDRIKHFLSLIRMKSSNKWLSEQLAQFFNETARIIRAFNAKNLPFNTIYRHLNWIVYLTSFDSILRNAIVEFCKAIFRNDKIDILLNTLLKDLPACITKCINSSNNIKYDDQFPTAQYFDLLYWTIVTSHCDNAILNNKTVFVSAMNDLGSLSCQSRSPIYDLLAFLKKGLPTIHIPIFFDNQTLSTFMTALSNIPNESRSYIEMIMPTMAYFINQVNPSHSSNLPNTNGNSHGNNNVDYTVVVNSNVFKLSLTYLLSEASPIYYFFEKVLNKNTAPIIAATVFEHGFLQQHLCMKFVLLILKNSPETSETFLKSNCCQIVTNVLVNRYENRLSLTNSDYHLIIPYIQVLNTFSKSYIDTFKGKKYLFVFDKMSPFNDFWVRNNNILKNLFSWIQMSSVPTEFTKIIFNLIQCVYCSDIVYAQNALSLLKLKPSDFLFKIHESLVINYIRLSYNICIAFLKSNARTVFLIVYKDLLALSKTSSYQYNEVALLSKVILLTNQNFSFTADDLYKVVNIYSSIFMNVKDMQFFSGYISQTAIQLAVDSQRFQQILPDWVFHCMRLVSVAIKTENFNELKIAQEFLSTGQNIAGIEFIVQNVAREEIENLIAKIRSDPDADKSNIDLLLYFEKFLPVKN
ncbi:hypothetical protein TRFO_40657 [Tritrichomonas foetus]|uniref:USP domain-containing protein n=1 Tax=Tritrichomonas foetus TaxID=1144522 RepID=A0A1J4J6G5_9EUKA|nr:hypothetical protein TRFO_40657 [Tritrichomonas foetus]|eukprot:OHS93021.1 hypothetical protein TRFO_40657 [Tritrichomonas foetus]